MSKTELKGISPRYYIIKSLYLFSPEISYKTFFSESMDIKSHLRGLVLPHIEDVTNLPNHVQIDRTDSIRLINEAIDLFNDIDPDNFDGMRETLISAAKRLVEEWSKVELIQKNPETLPNIFRAYVTLVLGSDKDGIMAATEALSYFWQIIGLGLVSIQNRKQKLIIGWDNENPIFQNVSCVFPTPEFLGTTMRFREGRELTRESALDWGNSYWTYPVMKLRPYIGAQELDIYPTAWMHPGFYEHLRFTETGQAWGLLIDSLPDERKYALPDHGITVECTGFGDIVKIDIKEVFRENTYKHEEELILLARVTFATGAQDIVGVNLSERGVFCHSGYTALDFDHDPVLDTVLKAYANVISNAQVSVRERGRKKQTTQEEPKTQSGQNFMYLPRRKTIHSGESNVRVLVGQSKRPHFVVGHMRKGTPSEMAIEYAKQYGIVLPEG